MRGDAAAAATDLVVIGGGPAGLATAIAARHAGMSARVIERSRPPIDKACGEGLMPDAVACLDELGVELGPGESCRFRGIRYLDGDVVAEGVFPQAHGLGVRRLHLHQALARRAAEVGVELWWGVAARGLLPVPAPAGSRRAGLAFAGGVLTDRPGLEVAAARWVIGADGLHSRVRRWAGLEGPPARHRRVGVRRHFACRPWTDLVEVHWGPGCEAYVTPVGPEEVGVAMLCGDPPSPPPCESRRAEASPVIDPGHSASALTTASAAESTDAGSTASAVSHSGAAVSDLSCAASESSANASDSSAGSAFDRLLERFPALAVRLAGAPATSRDRGAGPLAQTPRAVWRGNLALVGDASGYLDAITGEGLAVALHQAAALVAALRAGDLALYGARHRRIARLPNAMTSLLLAAERRPWLRRRMIRALAADPALFSRLLGIHAGVLHPALCIDGAFRLGYRLLAS